MIIEEMETYVNASLTKDVTFTVASPNAATDGRYVCILHACMHVCIRLIILFLIIISYPSRFVAIQSPQSLPKDMPDFTAGNRVGGNRKFFTHFLYWGAFTVSGQG